MTTSVIIPVTELSKAKSRLSSLLNGHERKQLALAMLRDVLVVISKSKPVKVMVVTRDAEVVRAARPFGCHILRELGNGLNSAVTEALSRTKRRYDRRVIIPADLPLASTDDLDFLTVDRLDSDVMLSPSRDGGTNAISLPARSANFRPQYGVSSFARHFRSLVEKGENPIAYWSFRMSLDIDTARDLVDFWRLKSATRTHRFLESIDFQSRLR